MLKANMSDAPKPLGRAFQLMKTKFQADRPANIIRASFLSHNETDPVILEEWKAMLVGAMNRMVERVTGLKPDMNTVVEPGEPHERN